jgi:hypothetical protein
MLLRFARISSCYYSVRNSEFQTEAKHAQQICTDPTHFKRGDVPDFLQPPRDGAVAEPFELTTVVELEWREGRDPDQWQTAFGAVYHAVSRSKAESKAPLKLKLCYIAVRLLMTLRNIILSGYAARMHPKFPTRFEAEARTKLLAEYKEGDVFMQFACRLGLFVSALDMLPSSEIDENNLVSAKAEFEKVLRDDANALSDREERKSLRLLIHTKDAISALFEDIVERSSDGRTMEADGMKRLRTDVSKVANPDPALDAYAVNIPPTQHNTTPPRFA